MTDININIKVTIEILPPVGTDIEPTEKELETKYEKCNAWGSCQLPRGHNMGKADVPSNHSIIPKKPTRAESPFRV